MSNDPELVDSMMDEYIWACAQCFACSTICPFLNNPGGAVAIMREIAVRRGLHSAKKVLRPYSRILYKLFTTGTQLSPDMLQPDFFRDWGPNELDIAEDLELKRKAIPIETLHSIDSAWTMDEETAKELYIIHKESGVLKMIKQVQPDTAYLVAEKFGDEE
jgi:heterodisulfide reductase subunit C